ncbi:MAG: hypothetical protein AB7T49_17855 [Oligoflexales bacterium]
MKLLLVLVSICGFGALSYAGSNEDRAIEISSAALTEAGIDISAATSIDAFCGRDGGTCWTTFAFSEAEVNCPRGGVEKVPVGKEVILFDFANPQIQDYQGVAECERRP